MPRFTMCQRGFASNPHYCDGMWHCTYHEAGKRVEEFTLTAEQAVTTLQRNFLSSVKERNV